MCVCVYNIKLVLDLQTQSAVIVGVVGNSPAPSSPRMASQHLPLAYFAHIFDSIAYNKFSCLAPDTLPSIPSPLSALLSSVLLFSFIKCFASMQRFCCPTARLTLSVRPSLFAYLSVDPSPYSHPHPSLVCVATPFPNAFSPARFGFLISVLILRFVLFRCDFD